MVLVPRDVGPIDSCEWDISRHRHYLFNMNSVNLYIFASSAVFPVTTGLWMTVPAMARTIFCFLLVSMNCALLDSLTRTVKLVYKPYGPKMCRELCEDSAYSFYYVEKDLSCHRIPKYETIKEISPDGDGVICTGRNTTFAVMIGQNICKTNYGGEDVLFSKNTFPFVTTMEKRDDTSNVHAQTTGLVYAGDPQLSLNNSNITLHQACLEGKLDVVRHILSYGLEDINCRGKMGRTPVMNAAQNGHIAVLDFLISQGCDLSVIDDNNDTVLHAACIGGNNDIVKKLLDTGKFEKYCSSSFGSSPMMGAVLHGHIETLSLLIIEKCNMEVADHKGHTLLHMACTGGHVDMVKYLLSQKCCVIDGRQNGGRTPLMLASLHGHRKVFDLLVCRGGKINLIDAYKSNVLHLACIGGHVDMVKYILALGIFHIDCLGYAGQTPMMVAAGNRHIGVFRLLVSEGCNLTVVDKKGNNVLHVACFAGSVEMVKYILSLGKFHLEDKGFCGWTPVMTAVFRGHREVFDILVSKGAHLTAVDKNRNNILHLACIFGHADMVKYIVSKHILNTEIRDKVGRTAILLAARNGHTDVLDILVRVGCQLNAVTRKHNNILHLACLSGNEGTVKYILSLDTFHVEDRNFQGRTPVMMACFAGHKGIINLLITMGCNLNAVDKYGYNILHAACLGGHEDMVKYILSLDKLHIDGRGFRGRTPVMLAAEGGHKGIIGLLVAKGCNLNVADEDGNNIFHVACLGGNVNLLKYLMTLGTARGLEKRKNKYGKTPLQLV